MNLFKQEDVQELWNKLDKKLERVAERSYDKLPSTAENGVHNDVKDYPWGWMHGFLPGIMWLMYDGTKKECYKNTARHSEALIDEDLKHIERQHHDAGFIFHLSAGADYRLTGDENALRRTLLASNILASRYNIDGGYIRAWEKCYDYGGDDPRGWAIIDCMLNIPLLYWASDYTKDDRFKRIAMCHADKTLENHVRPDGSVNHIVEYNFNNGEFVCSYGGQGFGLGSSWSRGQAWGLYGFVMSYIHTKEQRYLDAAKRIAHYFIACVCDDWLPRCDFPSPDEPLYYDISAGMIAACGLIELSRYVPEYEKKIYYNAAINLLNAATDKCSDLSPDTDNILTNSTEAYYEGKKNIPIIYADFFYVEAINKLMGFDTFLW